VDNRTTLKIRSSTAADTTNTTTIQYLNPEMTNEDIITFANMIIGLSTDTRKTIIKETKEVIDNG